MKEKLKNMIKDSKEYIDQCDAYNHGLVAMKENVTKARNAVAELLENMKKMKYTAADMMSIDDHLEKLDGLLINVHLELKNTPCFKAVGVEPEDYEE